MNARLQTAGYSLGGDAMSDVFNKIDTAYRATTYTIYLPSEIAEASNLELRVDHPSAALDRLLDRYHCDAWAFISAVNPGSQLLSHTANAELHRQLCDDISKLDLPHFAGDGIPDTPDWITEPGLMVLGISTQHAQDIASRFGQNAILAGIRGGVPTLHYCHT